MLHLIIVNSELCYNDAMQGILWQSFEPMKILTFSYTSVITRHAHSDVVFLS